MRVDRRVGGSGLVFQAVPGWCRHCSRVFASFATGGLSGRRRLVAVGIVVLAAAGASASVAADQSSASASSRSLASTVLKASQVDPGYRSEVIPGGQQVAGQVTLDLCYFTFPSESLRTARLQEAYVKASSDPEISNEVVTYRGVGALDALDELRLAVKSCPSTPRTGPTAGEQQPVTWHETPLSVPHLTSEYVAVRQVATGVVNGTKRSMTGFAIYQFNGSTMSGVYGYGTNAAATLALTVHAAQQSARNLG